MRIGYHRISDDSVSSGYWPINDDITERFLEDLRTSRDIDSAWFRLPGEEDDPIPLIYEGTWLPEFFTNGGVFDTRSPRPRVCPTRTPEVHNLGEFPMTCYQCHMFADS